MQGAPKLGLLPVLEGCRAEFRCGAVHANRGKHGAAGDEAVHGVVEK